MFFLTWNTKEGFWMFCEWGWCCQAFKNHTNKSSPLDLNNDFECILNAILLPYWLLSDI